MIALLLIAITVVRPEQIRNWRQVDHTIRFAGAGCPTMTTQGGGTRLSMAQVQTVSISKDKQGFIVAGAMFRREFRMSGPAAPVYVSVVGVTPHVATAAKAQPVYEGNSGGWAIVPSITNWQTRLDWDGSTLTLVESRRPAACS